MCKTTDLDSILLYEALKDMTETLKGVGYDEIVESYDTFYKENEEIGGDNFIYAAYKEIYNIKEKETGFVEDFTKTIENSTKMLNGIVGDAITEAVDLYLIDINMLAEEMGEEPEEKLTKEPAKG